MVTLALMPQWPGLVSHPWRLSRLQSQDWRLSGQTELGAGNVLPPMDLEGLLLSTWAPNLQIQVGPPAEKPRLLHPKNGGASGLGKLCMVPWAPYVPYFPTPASIFRAAPLTDDSTLCRVVFQKLVCPGDKGQGGREKRYKPGVFLLAHSP